MSKKDKANRKKERGKLKKRLLGYSLAAGAALAAGGSASADVVYSGPLSMDFGMASSDLAIAMEGAAEEFRLGGNSWYGTGGLTVRSQGPQDAFRCLADRRAGTSTYGYSWISTFPLALDRSVRVGPSTNTPNYQGTWLAYSNPTYGAWGDWSQDGDSHLVGMSFKLENASPNAPAGATVYGWLDIQRVDGLDGRLLGWAYEDSGDSIHVGDTGAGGEPAVPEPSGLALLATGAAGLAALRKKRQAA